MPAKVSQNLPRTVIVAGGAHGIGAACAELISQDGSHVVICDKDFQAAEALAKRIGGSAHFADLADTASIDLFLDIVRKGHAPIDSLIICAGILGGETDPIEVWGSGWIQNWNTYFEVNVRGTFQLARGIGCDMARRGRGSIVAMASVTGARSTPLHAYGTSKAAVIQIARNLAAEWGPSNVRVNSISPGYVMTDGLKHLIETGQRDPARIAASAVMRRVIQPEEIAQVARFLIGDESSGITGVDIPVDAGWLLAGSWMQYGGFSEDRRCLVDRNE
ncbi:SDR family oxidoreductase [Fertoebacter nigrum]|uniref:SDR family oxidoreductase n=1 Tax=Fertoeibacter niger TaxID=2656921 RepID=A0A8X8GVC2_9RHOB|nr:SDR family oxidoreductase [Fertoeibacter niger]NUB45024.1 SDR family oxidoreductase [Fertoeibacter niger]